MFTGNIYVTTDLNMVKQMLPQYKIVMIGDPDPNLTKMLNAVNGSILMPPYQALMANLDGNIPVFISQYRESLYQKEPSMFICVLFKALMQGTNILLYLNNDEYNMYFGTLMRHIAEIYGVVIGTPQNEFEYNPSFNWVICSNLYIQELISVEELFKLYPIAVQFPDFVINKLVYELKPKIENETLEGYRQYFFNLKNNQPKLKRIIKRGK